MSLSHVTSQWMRYYKQLQNVKRSGAFVLASSDKVRASERDLLPSGENTTSTGQRNLKPRAAHATATLQGVLVGRVSTINHSTLI